MRCGTVPSVGILDHCLVWRRDAFIVKNFPHPPRWLYPAELAMAAAEGEAKAEQTLCDVELKFLLRCEFFVNYELTNRFICCFLPKYVLSILIVIHFHVSADLIWSCVCLDLGARFHCICDTYIFLNSACIFASFKEASEEEHRCSTYEKLSKQ